jgi:4-aminobutyrate aminotransferase-like enzyme
MAPPGWLKLVYDWCQERGIVFILDEVQSSFGRTGTLFAFEQEGFVPNLVCLGKGIGSGVPISAVVGESRIMDKLEPGSLSSTNGGNPLSCRGALAAIDILLKERLPERAMELGKRMETRLCEIAARSPYLGDVRGQGLVWGLELVVDKHTKEPAPDLCRRVVEGACKRGLLMIAPIGFYGNVLRIAPPLVFEDEQMDRALSILAEVFATLL